jgi:hypothetical protein
MEGMCFAGTDRGNRHRNRQSQYQLEGTDRAKKEKMERTGRAENNEWIGYRSREKKKGTDSREQMKGPAKRGTNGGTRTEQATNVGNR